MKKHDRECLADWAKENRILGWEKIYTSNHPKEIAKRQSYGIRLWNDKLRIKQDKKRYK